MSISETETVDFATIDKATGDVWLVITDHLPWDEDEGGHLLLLQDKLNAYLRFIESGEMLQQFPQLGGRRICIVLAGKFPLSDRAQRFIEMAGAAIKSAGFALQFRLAHAN